jgi:predicted AlkP superfamily pyrophosphatase or phosphodiesterase
MADGAYWFDAASGNWVSSSFYFRDLPAWVQDVNKSKPADKFLGAEWKPVAPFAGAPATFGKLSAAPDAGFYGSLEATPFGNELVEQFTERAIDAEQLGKHAGVDLLTVSYSANDYVGHAFGPDSPKVHDMCLRTDEILGRLLSYIDQRIGPGNTLFVMIADHGVSPVPEVNEQRKMPGGRIPRQLILQTIQAALAAKYGDGQWVLSMPEILPYLNDALMEQKKLDRAEVEKTAADAVLALPHIFRVYTGEELLTGRVQQDSISESITNGYYQKRSGDLLIIPDAYYLFEAHGTSHGTPFNYDTHVPLIFMGAGIHAGTYSGRVAMNDIAPTLAAMLEIEEPSGSVGRALTEMFQQ